MWRLLIGLALAPGVEPDGLAIQRPGDAVVWALDWDAPPECPTRDDVIAAVRAYLPELDEPPVSPGRAALRVVVSVSADEHGWAAHVRMSGRDGVSERMFSAPACFELADATALIVAVALDPVLVTRGIRESASEPSEPEVVPPEPPVPADPPPLATSEPAAEPEPDFDLVLSTEPPLPAVPNRRVSLGLGVYGVGGWGPVEAGFGGLAGSFAVFADRWRWQLEGGWWGPRRLALDDGRRGRLQAWWVGTRGCVVPSLGAVELPLCPGIEVGQVFARGLAPTTNTQRESQLWAAVVVGQGLRWAFAEHLALTVEAALLIALVRGRFLIGDEPLTAIVPVGFRGGLGLEARF